MKEGYLMASGLRFAVVEDGPPEGPLTLLLHGFPETAYSWRHQLPALAAVGLHAVAPDLRGYGRSDKPEGVAAYDLDVLADDVVGLMAALGRERVRLVGHDWGGAVAWHCAARHPRRVERLAVLACPPPLALARALVSRPRQLARSWYMLFFQLPRLPERLLRGDSLRRWMRRWAGSDDVFTDEDLDRYVEAASGPGGLHAPLQYYRAAFRRLGDALRPPVRVRCPTLVLWGARDRILGSELTDGLERYVEGPLRVERVSAGHFLQQEAPDEVNRLLVDFLV